MYILYNIYICIYIYTVGISHTMIQLICMDTVWKVLDHGAFDWSKVTASML